MREPSQLLIQSLLRYEDGDLYWLETRGRRQTVRRAGAINAAGYLAIQVNNIKTYVHRLVWILHFGPIPKGLMIDHIDGDALNNHVENLRLVKSIDNQRNMKRFSNNKSGVTGVHFCKHYQRWMASIQVNCRHRKLGSFLIFSDAVAARKDAEKHYGFHPNHGRSGTINTDATNRRLCDGQAPRLRSNKGKQSNRGCGKAVGVKTRSA